MEEGKGSIIVEVEAEAEKASSSLKVINVDLSKLEGSLKNIETTLGKMSGGIDKIGRSSNNTNKNLKDMSNIISKLKTGMLGFSIFAIAKQFSGIGKSIMQLSSTSIDASEQLNLFNTVFKNVQENGETTFSVLGEKATKFQNQLHNAFNTNIVETMKMQAMYQSLGQNIGIKDTYAEIMSEAMTKMTYDLASLYNKSEEEVQTAIQSGVYAGQTRPMRAFGVDLTQNNLNVTLEALGINDRSISDMSQAEKEILRYLTTLNQAQVAMGDFAKTIDSPANQIKMLKQQFTELKIAIGNLFVNAFAKIAPYVNAIIMVAKELLKTLASLFGITLKDYGNGTSGVYELGEGLDGVGESADDASKAIKNLKRQTLGFDQINNLTTPTPSSGSKSGGSGSSGIGAIDQRLLDAIKDYDNGMDSVRNKAGEIRDKIMEWLGFTKDVNLETGEISWNYQGFKTTLSNMWDSFKNLSVEGKILAGVIAVIVTSTTIDMVKKFVGLLDKTGLLGVIKFLFQPLAQLKDDISKVFYTINDDGEKKLTDAGKKFDGFFEKLKTGFRAIISVAEVAVGSMMMGDAIKDMNENGMNLKNTFELITGAVTLLSGAIGVAQIAIAALGKTAEAAEAEATAGLSIIIGLIITAIGTAISMISIFNDDVSDTDSTLSGLEKRMRALNREIRKTDEGFEIQEGYAERLMSKLSDLVDENGKVIDGEEARAKVIVDELRDKLGLEIELNGNLITINGKVVESYQDIQKEIDKVISAKRKEAVLTIYQEEYQRALERSIYAEDRLKQATEKYNEAVRTGNKIEIAKAEAVLDRVKKENKADEDRINSYENYLGVVRAGVSEESELYGESVKYMSDVYGNGVDTLLKYNGEIKQTNEETVKEVKKTWSKTDLKVSVTATIDKAKSIINSLNGTKIQGELEISKAEIVQSAVNSLKTKANNLLSAFGFKANGGLFKNGSWKPITQYASGGLPSTGQMFIAREAGPELVGKIGNSTAVMNNNQIVSSVASGVAQAVSSVLGSGSDAVEVYVHTDEGTVIDRINRRKRQTGVCPIEF